MRRYPPEDYTDNIIQVLNNYRDELSLNLPAELPPPPRGGRKSRRRVKRSKRSKRR
jgi:hypothetical protein